MTFVTDIEAGLRTLGIDADLEQVHLLARHADAVLETTRQFNLTTIGAADAVPLHVLDSCAALPFLLEAAEGPFADLGSGAGYPGVPLHVLSRRPVHLVESVKKKAAFLSALSADLCLDSTVHPIRAEELANERGGFVTAVTARAVSALPSLVELAAPLLLPGGRLICLKGRPEKEELDRGDAAAAVCGMERSATHPVRVPGTDATRTVVVYRSARPPRIRLPRRNGMAQRQPLA